MYLLGKRFLLHYTSCFAAGSHSSGGPSSICSKRRMNVSPRAQRNLVLDLLVPLIDDLELAPPIGHGLRGLVGHINGTELRAFADHESSHRS